MKFRRVKHEVSIGRGIFVTVFLTHKKRDTWKKRFLSSSIVV